MNVLYTLHRAVTSYAETLRNRVAGARDRGDVPGWVLITMMTAGIVVALWIVAEPTLRNLLTRALNIAGDPSQ